MLKLNTFIFQNRKQRIFVMIHHVLSLLETLPASPDDVELAICTASSSVLNLKIKTNANSMNLVLSKLLSRRKVHGT